MNNLKSLAPVVLRLGLAAVFIWFGLSQLIAPTEWTAYIPSWATSLSGLAPSLLVSMNGAFEVCMALLLAFGLFNRPVATLLFLHMIFVVVDLGLSAIGVRDIGIMVGLLSIAFYGYDTYSWRFVLAGEV